jgi:hypothetical protein
MGASRVESIVRERIAPYQVDASRQGGERPRRAARAAAEVAEEVTPGPLQRMIDPA